MDRKAHDHMVNLFELGRRSNDAEVVGSSPGVATISDFPRQPQARRQRSVKSGAAHREHMTEEPAPHRTRLALVERSQSPSRPRNDQLNSTVAIPIIGVLIDPSAQSVSCRHTPDPIMGIR